MKVCVSCGEYFNDEYTNRCAVCLEGSYERSDEGTSALEEAIKKGWENESN